MIKTLIKAFIAAFSIYSQIPMPRFKWDSKDMKYHLIFFPFVGMVIGCVEYLIISFLLKRGINPVAAALIFTSIVIIITGGLHLDGYMDTMDALKSYGDRNKKLEILSDPHIGAFSVINLFLYIMLYLSGLIIIFEKNNKILFIIICFFFFISRTVSALLVLNCKSAKESGMLKSEQRNCDKIIVKIILYLFLLFSLIILFIFNIVFSIVLLILQSGFVFYFIKKITKEFGGITGDLAGFYLCMAEATTVLLAALYCLM